MKTPYARFLYHALNIFGGFTLFLAVFYVALEFLCRLVPSMTFHSGGYNPIELFGFAFLSLGLAQVLKLLDAK